MNSEVIMYQTDDGLTKKDSVWAKFAYTQATLEAINLMTRSGSGKKI